LLKNVSPIVSPDLLKTLCEMGHGDELVIADGNFPAFAYSSKIVRLDGLEIPNILKAILNLIPLDIYVKHPVSLMQVVPGDEILPTIWDDYEKIIEESNEPFNEFEFIDKFGFYERAKKAYATVTTSESALYANIIIKKGIITV